MDTQGWPNKLLSKNATYNLPNNFSNNANPQVPGHKEFNKISKQDNKSSLTGPGVAPPPPPSSLSLSLSLSHAHLIFIVAATSPAYAVPNAKATTMALAAGGCALPLHSNTAGSAATMLLTEETPMKTNSAVPRNSASVRLMRPR